MIKDYNSIVWSPQSEHDLDLIFEYYLKISPEQAHKHILDILDGLEDIVFSKQWQIDEYDPTCHRAIIKRKFRVLYKVIDKTILITRLYPTKKIPKNYFSAVYSVDENHWQGNVSLQLKIRDIKG